MREFGLWNTISRKVDIKNAAKVFSKIILFYRESVRAADRLFNEELIFKELLTENLREEEENREELERYEDLQLLVQKMEAKRVYLEILKKLRDEALLKDTKNIQNSFEDLSIDLKNKNIEKEKNVFEKVKEKEE